MSKKIAYYDYDLNNFHADTYLSLCRGDLADRGFEVVSCKGLVEGPSREWAKKNGVAYAESVEELVASADYIMVLAPSNPEVHFEMAEKILPFGKITYIDKTFAPDYDTAAKIFALADKYNTQMISSSALRYTDELRGVLAESGRDSIRQLQVWGGGSSFQEYAIHQVEMVVSTMGKDISQIMCTGSPENRQILFKYADGCNASAYVCIGTQCPYLSVVTTDVEVKQITITSPIFANLFSGVMDFFQSGKATIDKEETLVIRRVLDISSCSDNLDKWVSL